MAVPWGLIVFLVGIAYGYFAQGRQDKSEIFKRALLWGAVLAVILAIIGWATGAEPLGLGEALGGILGFIISVAILAVVFILGVWLGDWLEHRKEGTPART